MITLVPNHQDLAVVLPLQDNPGEAVNALKAQLQLLALSGALTVSTQPRDQGGEIVTISGSGLPNTIQYTLTGDNLLVIATGTSIAQIAAPHASTAALSEVNAVWPAMDHFFYLFVDQPDAAATLTIGGQIRRQSLFVDAVLRAP